MFFAMIDGGGDGDGDGDRDGDGADLSREGLDECGKVRVKM